jgi:hypothetical protein
MVHNNTTHQSGPIRILESVKFLLAMESSLNDAGVGTGQEALKKKQPAEVIQTGKEHVVGDSVPLWSPPPSGWTKVNVDGSYVDETGAAGVGVVARDSMGMIIFTAWRSIQRCASAAEVEAQACVEGLKMAVRLAPGQVILETDCCRLVKALQGKEDRSEIGFFVAEVKELG